MNRSPDVRLSEAPDLVNRFQAHTLIGVTNKYGRPRRQDGLIVFIGAGSSREEAKAIAKFNLENSGIIFQAERIKYVEIRAGQKYAIGNKARKLPPFKLKHDHKRFGRLK